MQVIRGYDVILIQEIQMSDSSLFQNFMKKVNDASKYGASKLVMRAWNQNEYWFDI